MGLLQGLRKFLSGQPGKPVLDNNLATLSAIIQFPITKPQLFYEALRHRSFLQLLPESKDKLHSNERLEFLGDSILNIIVGEYLFHTHLAAEEGELTKMRSRLVNKKALATYAKHIRLKEFIQINPAQGLSINKGAETIIADGFEAIIAAIYLDGGYAAAKEFVEREMISAIERGELETSDENFKSQLLELSQAQSWGMPFYAVISEEGPDHNRTFTVSVTANSHFSGEGRGKTKKDAEQLAAFDALEKIRTAAPNDVVPE